MPTDNNRAGLTKRLLDRMDVISRSRAFRVLRRLQPAFVVIPLVGAVIAVLTFCSTPSPPPPTSPLPTCNKTDIQREIEFRIKQVDEVMDGRFTIENRDPLDSCARATSIFVISQLGGIAKRPPPKEDETIWIGHSGYGYRHTPSKTGSRSIEFASFSLSELVSDYLSCAAKQQPGDEKRLKSKIATFKAATESHLEKVQSCDQQWIDDAEKSWESVRSTAIKLAEIDD